MWLLQIASEVLDGPYALFLAAHNSGVAEVSRVFVAAFQTPKE